MNQTIQGIRKKLYLCRNGASSSSMREKGIKYKTNFGVPVTTLRKIAKEYAPNSDLAEELWQENTRELKILATLIQNPQSFQNANEWVNSISNLELAEQFSMNLVSKLPDAGKYASEWINEKDLHTKICGFLVYSRLFMQDYQMEENEYNNYFNSAFNALNSDSLLLKNSAVNSLKYLGRQSVTKAKYILAECKSTTLLSTETKANIYDNLQFEFDYYA